MDEEHVKSFSSELSRCLVSLNQYKSKLINGQGIEVASNFFRIIRNLCSVSPFFQNHFVSEKIYHQIIQFIVDFRDEKDENLKKTCYTIGAQAVVNMSAMNQETQDILWQNIVKTNTFRTLLDSNNQKASLAFISLLKFCLDGSNKKCEDLIRNEDGIQILRQILTNIDHQVSNEHFNVIYEICETFFLNDFWNDLNQVLNTDRDFELETTLIKFLDGKIDSEISGTTNGNLNWITPKTLLALCSQLETKLKKSSAFLTSINSNVESLNVTEDVTNVYILLEILGNISKIEILKVHLRETRLISILIGYLEVLRVLKPLNSYKNTQQINEHKMFFGHKVSVIKILSNMSHKNKNTQDEIREMGGIILILENLNIDESNPFVKEWSIVTLKNLLEGNSLNQELIHKLKSQGVVQSESLQELGFNVVFDPHGRPSIVKKK